MTRMRLAIALAVCASAAGQDRTDFSGTWKMDPTQSESAHQAAPIGPVSMVIRQTAGEISIETRRKDAESPKVDSETLVFKLDGGVTTLPGNGKTPVKTKAHWDGAKVVVETEREIQDSTVTTMQVLSLDAKAKELTVEKTLTIQHGYQSPGARNTGTGKDVFLRSGSGAGSDRN